MQEIIVYRNPLEAALWNGGFLIIAVMIAAALLAAWVVSLIDRLYQATRYNTSWWAACIKWVHDRSGGTVIALTMLFLWIVHLAYVGRWLS